MRKAPRAARRRSTPLFLEVLHCMKACPISYQTTHVVAKMYRKFTRSLRRHILQNDHSRAFAQALVILEDVSASLTVCYARVWGEVCRRALRSALTNVSNHRSGDTVRSNQKLNSERRPTPRCPRFCSGAILHPRSCGGTLYCG